jgi:iron(III) transport system substrate-binding protein
MISTKRTALQLLCGGSSVAALLVASGALAADPQKVVVYTALQAEQLPVYEKAFEAKNPKYDIEWVRGTPAEITAKLLAEKGDPQADVIWGLGASYLMAADKNGQLEHYRLGQRHLLQHPARRRAQGPEARGLEGPGRARL